MSAIVLDTETTGVLKSDRITEIAIVSFETKEVLIHTYVNPEVEIPEMITEITGITNETVKDAPKFRDIADQVSDIIGLSSAMIGHNPWFDQRMIAAEMERCDASTKWPILICTKRMWDIHEPRDKRHLQNAYKRFVHREGFEGAHGAFADTMACLEVFYNQIEEFGLDGKSWDEFDPNQKTWMGPSDHIVWSENMLILNFGKYKGIPCHKIEKGYWNWICNQDFPEHVKTLADYLTVVNKNADADDLASWAYGRFS